jgi:hypothetical protein
MDPVAILNLVIWSAQGAFSAAAQAWSEPAASVLISSLWQGALVASGLALCLRLAPTISARLRYTIWAAGFAALVCLPFLPALFDRLSKSMFAPASANSFSISAGSASHPLLALDARWSLAIAALWLAASLARASSLAAHAVRMSRLWRSASPVGAPDLDSLFQKAAGAPSFRRSLPKGWDAIWQSLGRMNSALRAPAELCVTNDLDRPCVIGFFRPRILIPTWLLNRLSPAELEQVVLHESEHLRRMDDWTNLLQKLCLVVFPLNPALWWLERRLCAEREIACDDAVVGHTKAPRAYAACLAGLAEKGLQHREAALSLGAWQRRPELATRVHRLLRRPPVLSPAASAATLALVGCGLIAGTVVLARSPQLVAFVAPANQASNPLNASARSDQPSLQGDANTDFAPSPIAFAGSSAQPYHVVKTLAILPAAPDASLPPASNATQRTISHRQPDDARQSAASNPSGHSLASLVPEAIAARMNAQRPSPPQAEQVSQSAEPPAAQTSYLVLTTYEEVRTIGSGEEIQGDAVVSESSTTSSATSAKPSTTISVTRLVLRFEQPASKVHSDSSGQPAPAVLKNSNSAQPIAIPWRGGWLVIRL